MTHTETDRSEALLRFSRRSMFLTLFLVLALGGVGITLSIAPHGALSRALMAAPWLMPVTIVLIAAATQTMQRKTGWRNDSPEVRVIMEDELRRTSLNRAIRVAFIVVLVMQIPLALVLSNLPTQRALLAMATSTITIGVALVAALFLYFDRE